MAETSQEPPLDHQALDMETDSPKHSNLQPSSAEVTQDNDVQGVDPPQDQELQSIIQDHDGLHCPLQQYQNLDCLDQDQAGLHCTDQNQLHIGRPDDLCLGEATHLSTCHLDQLQERGCPHDSHQEAKQCERSNEDHDHVQEEDSVCSLNLVQTQKHDRSNNPLEEEVQVKVKASDPPQDQQEVQGIDQHPEDGHGQGFLLASSVTQHSELSEVNHQRSLPVLVQDQLQDEHCHDGDPAQQQDQGQRVDLSLDGNQDKSTADQNLQLLEPRCDNLPDIPSYFTAEEQVRPRSSDGDLAEQHDPPHDAHQGSPKDQDQVMHQGEDHKVPLVHQAGSSPEQDLTTAAHCEDGAAESSGSTPALVITQAEESVVTQPAELPAAGAAEPQKQERPADLTIPVAASTPTDPSPSSSDGGDTSCCDLLSLKGDSISLASELTISRRSEEGQEDDTRSVAASSVMSLFHRVQLDPLEKDWLRCSAVGNTAAQRRLLAQDPSLALKKTALHWAAKQGRLEAVDMMLRSGVDVNVRSGYTALHLASIHGHQRIVQALINTYHAKTNVRDYHGKMAVHYWSGNTDIFNKPDCHTGGKLFRGRRTQRYGLPSLLLSRSRSQGQLNLDFGPAQQSPHEALDLQI